MVYSVITERVDEHLFRSTDSSCHVLPTRGIYYDMEEFMGYRIVELHARSTSVDSPSTVIGDYDSAYQAMRVMKDELGRRGSRPPNWYLLDPRGRILAYPEDVVDALVA